MGGETGLLENPADNHPPTLLRFGEGRINAAFRDQVARRAGGYPQHPAIAA